MPASCLVARKLTDLRHPIIQNPAGLPVLGPTCSACGLRVVRVPAGTPKKLPPGERAWVCSRPKAFSRYSLRLDLADNAPRYLALEEAFEECIA